MAHLTPYTPGEGSPSSAVKGSHEGKKLRLELRRREKEGDQAPGDHLPVAAPMVLGGEGPRLMPAKPNLNAW